MPLILSEENPHLFEPLTLMRATFELRFGAMSPLERALQKTPDVALRCRPHLAAYLRAKTGLRVNEDAAGETFPGLPYDAPWDVLANNDKLIAADFADWNARHANHREAALMNGAHIIGSPGDVHIGADSFVQPGCILDVSGGPIVVGAHCQIKWSQIQGPVFIGEGCIVDGARLRPGTSLGAHCKVGGEVSASIFQSRANKSHEGFVGHSWLGRWVNLGALATTSNLKNTYGNLRFQRDCETTVETRRQFLGSLVGDHAKIGIGQMLTTGANIGVGCNVFGGAVAPKYVPSFAWGGVGGWQENRIEDCLKVARAVVARRGFELRAESENVLRAAYESTKEERAKWLLQRVA